MNRSVNQISSGIKRLRLMGVRPVDVVWDKSVNTFFVSHNGRVEKYDKIWRPCGIAFHDHHFSSSPYVLPLGQRWICANSGGTNTIFSFSRGEEKLIIRKNFAYFVGRLYRLDAHTFIASCYTENGDVFLNYMNEHLEIIDRHEMGKWPTMALKSDMQCAILDNHRLLLLEHRSRHSQFLVEYDCIRKTTMQRWPLFTPGLLITTTEIFKGKPIIAGRNFLASLDSSFDIETMIFIENAVVSLLRVVEKEPGDIRLYVFFVHDRIILECLFI